MNTAMETAKSAWFKALEVADRTTNLDRTSREPTPIRPVFHLAAEAFNSMYTTGVKFEDEYIVPIVRNVQDNHRGSKFEIWFNV